MNVEVLNSIQPPRSTEPPVEPSYEDSSVVDSNGADVAPSIAVAPPQADAPDPGGRVDKSSSKVLASVRDIFISPAAGSLITVALLALCTWWILWLREFTQYDRPYTILYLVPVAIGAAFLGLRGGVAASVAALLLTRIYLLNDHKHGWALASATNLAEGLEFTTLTMGTLVIAVVTGRLRKTLGSLHASHMRLEEINHRLSSANALLIESENQRRTFNSEVLLAVTGGKLNLVERGDILPRELAERPPAHTQPLLTPLDASCLRQDLHQLATTPAHGNRPHCRPSDQRQ